MSRPVVVNIPHRLGRQEAVRRLKTGFGNVRSTFGQSFVVMKDEWAGDHLDFRASLLGQTTTGTVDVADDHVRLEVQLPWLLSLLADKAKALVQKQGKLMLEKPSKLWAQALGVAQEILMMVASPVPASTTSPACFPSRAWATGET